MGDLTTGRRTAHQIVDKTGQPYQASVTSNVWVATTNRFADATANNKIVPFTTGAAYFADLIAACKAAQSEICIAGWQVNWDALLAPGVRLYDLLYEVAASKKALNIYVMPWSHSLPVETYDGQTATVLRSINDRLGTKQVKVIASPSYADKDRPFFSHHQKQVMIDKKIAFMGGMDIAYGRFDDATFDLNAASKGREAMNRYNGCVEQVGQLDSKALVNPDLMTGGWDNLDMPYVGSKSDAAKELDKLAKPGHWQMKYGEASLGILINAKKLAADTPDLTTLDAATQPRMPWQDVHCRIEGPAVSDLMRNFVLRWNIEATKADRLPMPDPPSKYAAAGQCHVQVLRSAPAGHCSKEQKAISPKLASPTQGGVQHDIHDAMLLLIEKSRRFIYIENQFFVGGFGKEASHQADLTPAAQFIDKYSGKSQSKGAQATAWNSSEHKSTFSTDFSDAIHPPTNRVCSALIQRIKRSIMDIQKPAFHVYITLPVHSEGMLIKAAIAVQVYWTMQTLVFGSQSLLNGIRRALKARELRDAKDAGYERAFLDANTEFESVPIEKCFEYVTLMNLRNWTKVGDRFLTEQVYVHSKLMIVDDMYALLGSANVNDRSLLGDRDSELAVLVMDGATKRANVNGTGSQREVRLFAHDLRKEVWKKLFGITGGVRPATELAQAIEEPGKPESWKLIQRRAAKNAELYEAAFPWVPRSWVTTETGARVEASILPTWDADAKAPTGATWSQGNLGSPMPFQKEFWTVPRQVNSAAGALEQIRGFITALPVMWTKGENNRFDYPTALVADNDVPAAAPVDKLQATQASLNQSSSATPTTG